MDECNRMKNLFLDAISGELNDERRTALEAHLAGCEACAHEFAHCQAFMDLLPAYRRPEPGEEYWDRWQETLERRLASAGIPAEPEGQPERHWCAWAGSILRAWKPAAAAAVLIGVCSLAWLLSSPSGRQDRRTAEIPPSPHAYASVTREAMRYLDRSKLVLLGMRNFDPEGAVEFRPSFERESAISRQLILESAPLKEKLASSNHMRLYGLVNDLDVVLLEIANLERDYTPEEVELIRFSTERKNLLFKINMENMLSSTEDDTPSSTETMS